MDINRRDFFVSIPASISNDTPVSWFEGYKANVAYNNMPLIERVQEERLFGNVDIDPEFDVAANISEDLLPFYDDLVRAKNSEHLQYLEGRAYEAIRRREIAANASLTAQLAGGITDPLALVAFIPGLNFIKAGQTFGQVVLRAGGAGLGYGLASEARRAPFAVADERFEAASNIVASTAISAGFGGLLKGAGYAMPFIKSSAGKMGRVYRGEKFSHVWGDNKVNLDEDYVEAAGGDFDITQMNWIGSDIQKILADKTIPQEAKELLVKLSYNSSVPLEGARRGHAVQSVAQEAITFIGRFERDVMRLRDLHSQQVRGIAKAARVGTIYNPLSGFDAWADDTIRRYILSNSTDPRLRSIGKEGITDQQKEGGVILADMIKMMGEEIEYNGLSKSIPRLKNEVSFIENNIIQIQDSITKKTKLLADIETTVKGQQGGGATKKQIKKMADLENEIDSLRAKVIDNQAKLNNRQARIDQGGPRDNYIFPLFYNKEKLLDGAEREILTQKFAEDFALQRASRGESIDGTRADAEDTLAKIMEEDGEDFDIDFGNVRAGLTKEGKAKHLKRRKTNIDPAKVVDFIHADLEALYTYMDRMGRRISFANKYNGRSVDDVLEDLDGILIKAGKNEKERARVKTAFYSDYERVMGTFLRSVNRWDTQLARAAKAWTGWAFLPLAGLSAITDAGSIVLAHGMKDVWRAGFAATDTAFLGKVIREGQLSGELLDIAKNVYAREMLNDTVRKVKPNMLEKVIQRGNQFMYTANLLAPITFVGKTLDQLIINDKFIKLSRKWASGSISKFDREYLARYGIDEDLAKFIAKAPTEKHDRYNFEFANTDAWDQSTPAARAKMRQYQAALASHANNTIVMGQTFDKPLIVDGVVYMRDNPFFKAIRKRFPTQFKIEERLRTGQTNMVRVESGLMSLPFTFMNFAFGANNKILGAVRDPNRQYRLQGVAALFGLSYLSLAAKKPDYWFEKRESPEIIARIIDHSGVLGIYSDLAYMGLNIAGNMGMPTPIPPRFVSPNKDERMMDAFIEPFGATVGLGVEYSRALNDFMNGQTSDAAERLKYSLPFIGLHPIRDDMRDFIGSVGRN